MAVEFADELRRPLFVELGELRFEIDFLCSMVTPDYDCSSSMSSPRSITASVTKGLVSRSADSNESASSSRRWTSGPVSATAVSVTHSNPSRRPARRGRVRVPRVRPSSTRRARLLLQGEFTVETFREHNIFPEWALLNRALKRTESFEASGHARRIPVR